MKLTILTEQELDDTYGIIDNCSEDFDTPKPCTLAQLQELFLLKESEQPPIQHAGISAARFDTHPAYGDVIILTSTEPGGIMIHA